MSSLLNVPSEEPSQVRIAPRSRVLLLAHPDLAEPTARHLRRLGCEVTIPPLPADPTAEDCAALLFPPIPATRAEPEARRRFIWKPAARAPVAAEVGPPAFFAWNAFDAVVMQDLWPSAADERRLIPFGCTVVTADYYARGNFHQPKIVLITDPGFYKSAAASGTYDETLRAAFDRNEQIYFVPLLGDGSAGSLSRIASLLRRRSNARAPIAGTRRKERRRFPRDASAAEQTRALSLLTSSLSAYVRHRARVVLVDDWDTTVKLVAAQFGRDVQIRETGRVHFVDLTEGTTVSHASFDDLRRASEQVVEQARRKNELLLLVTDILFDAVEWDGERKTGIDLIEAVRVAQRAHQARVGIVGLTGIGSPLVLTSAFLRGADSVVSKSTVAGATLHHANDVNDLVIYKLLLTMASHCFQHEFLYAKRHAPVERARAESFSMRRILPNHAVSPHLQAEWEATQYLLEAQATYAQSRSGPAERVISRIREQYD